MKTMPRSNTPEISKKVNVFIGSKIYSLRLANGISREQLANIIKISQQQIAKYEKGGDRLSVGMLFLIAKALKEDIGYFYKGLEEAETEEVTTQHQRLCIEISRNFMKIKNPEYQEAAGKLIKTLSK